MVNNERTNQLIFTVASQGDSQPLGSNEANGGRTHDRLTDSNQHGVLCSFCTIGNNNNVGVNRFSHDSVGQKATDMYARRGISSCLPFSQATQLGNIEVVNARTSTLTYANSKPDIAQHLPLNRISYDERSGNTNAKTPYCQPTDDNNPTYNRDHDTFKQNTIEQQQHPEFLRAIRIRTENIGNDVLFTRSRFFRTNIENFIRTLYESDKNP